MHDASNSSSKPSAVKPIDTQQILDALPSLIGGIDGAIRDIAKTKTPVGFVLVIFAEGKAMFATNGNPESAKNCIQQLAKSWDDAESGAPVVVKTPTE